jgi:hypothetical protein
VGGPQQVRTEQVSRCARGVEHWGMSVGQALGARRTGARCAQVMRQEVHAGPWRGCWYIGQCATEGCQRGRGAGPP